MKTYDIHTVLPIGCVFAGLALWCSGMVFAEPVAIENRTEQPARPVAPLGHRQFYPSPERPLGFRGDGSGHFPGATPVLQWWEGTPGRAKMTVGHREEDVWTYTDHRATNIVWKTPMPGWSSAQPLPVGDRVFCICDPDWILCVDAHSGKILWRDRASPMLLDGLDEAEARRRQAVVDIARATTLLGRLTLTPTREDQPAAARQALARLRELETRMQRVESDPGILGGFDAFAQKLEGVVAGTNKLTHGAAGSEFVAKAVGEKYDVVTLVAWLGHVGLAVCTPVADGENVYAVFGQGQVVCYGLDGTRRWGFRLKPDGLYGMLMAGHWPAPLLYRGTLIVRNLNGQELHGVDARTGAMRWHTVLTERTIPHHAYAGHTLLRVAGPDGHNARTVLVTSQGAILDPDTGVEVGRWTYGKDAPKGHGMSVVGRDGLFFWSQGTDGNTSLACRGYRVSCEPDKIRVAAGPTIGDPTARHPMVGPFGYGPVALTMGGILTDGVRTWDAQTGRYLAAAQHANLWEDTPGAKRANARRPKNQRVPERQVRRDLTGASIAGERAIFTVRWPGNHPKSRFRADKAAMTPFYVVDISAPRKPTVVADRNLLGGTDVPKDLIVDTYLPDVDRDALMGPFTGLPTWFGCRNGGAMPMANRIFIQSATHLYCIGDPRVPYDWDPASRSRRASTREP